MNLACKKVDTFNEMALANGGSLHRPQNKSFVQKVRYDTIRYGIILCTILYYTELYCTVLSSTFLYLLYCTVSYCTFMHVIAIS